MKRVLVAELNDGRLWVYNDTAKICEDGNHYDESGPCIFKGSGGWFGHGSMTSGIKKPSWFQPPYMYCNYDERIGKLL